jgi:hypothetical protein
VTYEEATERFSLTPEQKAVFADEDSPVLMTGGFHTLAAVFANEPRLANAFEAGNGIGWGDHCTCLFCGTERFFRPGYKAHLVSEWLPALDGVVERLERGILVADVGCGHDASTAIMAEASRILSSSGSTSTKPRSARPERRQMARPTCSSR